MLNTTDYTSSSNPDEEQRRDAANRADMRHFQKRGRRRLRRRILQLDLGHLLWLGTLKRNPDARSETVPGYIIELLLGLIRAFAVKDSAEAPRLRSPEKFQGEWRRLPRKELAWLCPEFGGSVSLHQMNSFLRVTEDWGIITRWASDQGNHCTLLLIRFNAARLLEIIDVEIPRARKERYRKAPRVTAQPIPGSDQAAVDLQSSAVAIASSSSTEQERLPADREEPAIGACLEPKGLTDNFIQRTPNQST